jgi:uncharacterized protein
MRHALRFLAVLVLLSPAAAQEKKKYKILFITQSKGFKHGSVNRKDPAGLAPSEVSVTEIAKESGLFDVECTQDASVLTADKLKELDAVMFYTTGNLPITPEAFTAFEDWLKSGKAMIATHSATDTFGGFRPYFSLINGTFDGHPWGSGETVPMTNHDAAHVTAKMLGEEFSFKDEIYQYKNYDPTAVRVIYSINMAKSKTKQPYHVPVSWVRESGKGRLFYTNLGHNESTWAMPLFKQHLLTGIRWALHLEEGSAVPNPETQYVEQAKAFIHVAAGGAEGLLSKVAAAKDVEKLAALYKKIDEHRRGKGDKAALKEEIIADINKL